MGSWSLTTSSLSTLNFRGTMSSSFTKMWSKVTQLFMKIWPREARIFLKPLKVGSRSESSLGRMRLKDFRPSSSLKIGSSSVMLKSPIAKTFLSYEPYFFIFYWTTSEIYLTPAYLAIPTLWSRWVFTTIIKLFCLPTSSITRYEKYLGEFVPNPLWYGVFASLIQMWPFSLAMNLSLRTKMPLC